MSDDYEDMVKKYGASILGRDENLRLEKEDREEIIFWGSIYGSEFSQMPDTALTSEAEYGKWCWKKTGMMPEKRTSQFDKYIRQCMVMAETREVPPGAEFGVEIEEAIEEALSIQVRSIKCLDAETWDHKYSGDAVWVETVDPNRGEEIIVKINALMKIINGREAMGNTEGQIKRRAVIERLLHYGRKVAGRDGSINRFRSTYALPISYLEGGLSGKGGFDGIHKNTKEPGRVVPFTTKR